MLDSDTLYYSAIERSIATRVCRNIVRNPLQCYAQWQETHYVFDAVLML
jgi:hypothetical protein